MRQIIDGLRYDTKKAKLIGVASSSCGVTDFRYFEAGLYLTKSGRFFLAGEGGPMSMWRDQIDHNSWGGGSGIIPLSKHDALEWAEDHLDEDLYEEHFADLIEDA